MKHLHHSVPLQQLKIKDIHKGTVIRSNTKVKCKKIRLERQYKKINNFDEFFDLKRDFEMASDCIGKGGYGSVFKATNRNTQTVHALKRIVCKDTMIPEWFLKEQKILQILNGHKNIVKFYGVAIDKTKFESTTRNFEFYLVFEHMDFDLNALRAKNGPFSIPQAKYILEEVLNGMQYIHSQNIIHRDIKPANILINKQGEVKIADFGLATFHKDKMPHKTDMVTANYRAPELFLNSGICIYGFEVDIWSLGCIALELIAILRFNILFMASTHRSKSAVESEILDKIFDLCGSPVKGKIYDQAFSINPVRVNKYIQVPKKSSIEVRFGQYFRDTNSINFIKKMLTIDPRQRITSTQALDSCFFMIDPEACTKQQFIQHIRGL